MKLQPVLVTLVAALVAGCTNSASSLVTGPAEIEVSPASVSFTFPPPGATDVKAVEVRNTGDSLLRVESIVLSGDSDSAFSATLDLPAPAELRAGEGILVQLGFAPVELRAHAGRLLVSSDDSDEPLVEVPIGSGEPVPDIAASPAAIAFGPIATGSDTTETLTLSNAGNYPLVISSIGLDPGSSASFALLTPALPQTFGPGESVALPVTFAPQSAGAHAGAVVVTSNDPDESPLLVPLSGSGVEPDIAVSPLSLSFGTVVVGACATLPLDVGNEGGAVLHVTSIQASHPVFSATPTHFNLQPGDSQSPTARFCPTASANYSGTLSLSSDDPDEDPVTVFLSGTGVTPPAPDIAVAPASLDFGDVERFECATRSLTVGNVGNAALAVSSITASASEYTASPSSFVVAPSGSTSVTVTFCPMNLGSVSGTLTIASNDPDEDPVLVSLDGTGVPPAVANTDVHLELTWVRDGVDLDVHWIRPGAAIGSATGDCYWGNCTPSAPLAHPDWGVPGNTMDDPYLDLDDVNGLGPENMNQANPEDGSFKVSVHYFDDYVPNGFANSYRTIATLKVYLNGVLARTFSKDLREGDLWEVAWVHWSAGTGTVEQITTSGVTASFAAGVPLPAKSPEWIDASAEDEARMVRRRVKRTYNSNL